MATEIQKFIIQSLYYVENLESMLFGNQINKNTFDPGLVYFKSQMCENYEDMKHYAYKRIKDIYINDKIDKIVHGLIITHEDYLNLYKLYEARYSMANSSLVYAYEMLDKGASKLTKHKRKLLFSAKNDISKKFVEHILKDYNACGDLNEIFLDMHEEYNAYKLECIDHFNKHKIKPSEISREQIDEIMDLERRAQVIAQYYTDFKGTGNCAIKNVYDAVGNFITNHILPTNITHSKKLAHTEFDRDAKYVKFDINAMLDSPVTSL